MGNRTISTDENIRLRHIKRQNEIRRSMKRRRITFYVIVSALILSIILFFTPLFNIKKIDISGNNKIETAQIKQAIGSVEEDNLFRLNTKKLVENVKTISYVNDVTIKKSIFPVGLRVTVDECIPAGYILYSEQYVILDSTLKVLEVSPTPIEGICEISGLSVMSAPPGAIITADDNDKLASVIDCMQIFSQQELMASINAVNFSDVNNITFTYENRLNVVCGSTVDFSKKIGMFKKAVNSSKLTSNSRGTIDISISGKAIYTP